MDWKKLSPWNWMKKEQGSSPLPVVRREEVSTNPLLALHQEVDRLFADAMRGFRLSAWPEVATLSEQMLKPSLDITESEKAYTIRVEMPGVNREDVSVSVEGDSLIVQGEKREEKVREEEHCHYTERSYGSFQRVLALPADADPDGLTARFRDGVLTVTVGRREGAAAETKRISIE